VEALRRAKGAGRLCHFIGPDDDLDGRDMDLREALEHVVGVTGGALLSCIPGCLAYYESEQPGERIILFRHPGPGSR
jgi:hypothetical protein